MIPLKTVSRMNAIEEEFAWMLEQRKRTCEIVDYAFWKGLLFVGLVCVLALLYRLIAARLLRGR